MPFILGTNSIKDTTYEVANSLRFDDGSSDALTRTQSSSPTHDDKGTISFWFKSSFILSGNNQYFFTVFTDVNTRIQMFLKTTGSLRLIQKVSASTTVAIETNRLFRDPSAWYHCCLAIDTTQSTSSDRVKLYINGVQETSLASSTYPTQNENTQLTKGTDVSIGGYNNTNDFFNGYLAEVVLIDGQQLDPTSFGEFDSDSPTIWKPIDVSGLTFGTNGFYLDFENSSSLGADVSGNSNNFTVNNLTSIDQSTDTCTNNFATLNPLVVIGNTGQTYEEGNLTFGASGNNWTHTNSTIGASQGKWYAEFKIDTLQSSTGYGNLGITSTENITNSPFVSTETNSAGFGLDHRSGQSSIRSAASAVTSNIGDFSNGDIVGLAVDMDNKALYLHKAGTYYQINSVTGVPTSGSSKTGAITIPAGIETFVFAVGGYSTDFKGTFNFGSPPFSISSGNSDANGYGNFEYSVPSGYYALNTKNLAEFG